MRGRLGAGLAWRFRKGLLETSEPRMEFQGRNVERMTGVQLEKGLP